MGNSSINMRLKLLVFMMVILLFLITPVDSVIRIPLTKTDAPPPRENMNVREITSHDDPGRSGGASDISPIRDSISSQASQTAFIFSLGSPNLNPIEITKTYHIDNSKNIWISTEISCISDISGFGIDIIEVTDKESAIEKCYNCKIIRGDSSNESIDELAEYSGVKLGIFNTNEFEICGWHIRNPKNHSNIIHIKIEDQLNRNDKIIYTYKLNSSNENNAHMLSTKVRLNQLLFYQDVDETIEIKTNPEFKIFLVINQYYARFDEKIPLEYEIEYLGGSSNPYIISNISIRNCKKIIENQDMYRYYIDGMKSENETYLVTMLNIENIPPLYTNNNKYILNKNLSISFSRDPSFWNTIWPYQNEYELPGIYIDGIYYYPETDKMITVNNWPYRNYYWFIPLLILGITLWYARKEFKIAVKYIKDISNNIGSINKEISYMNKSLKNWRKKN